MSKPVPQPSIKSPDSKNLHHEKREKAARLFGEQGLKSPPEFMMEPPGRRHFSAAGHLEREQSSYHRPLFLDMHHDRNPSGRSMYPEMMNRSKSPLQHVRSPRAESGSSHPSLLRTIDHPGAPQFDHNSPFMDMDKSNRIVPRHHELERKAFSGHMPFAPAPSSASNPNLLSAYSMGGSNPRYGPSHR